MPKDCGSPSRYQTFNVSRIPSRFSAGRFSPTIDHSLDSTFALCRPNRIVRAHLHEGRVGGRP
jgi:hypothetical protein